jgi:hypothetical protein
MIADAIFNGTLFDLKNWKKEMPSPVNLPEAIELLFEILEERKIEYVLVGGIAMLSYVEGRNTQDIDFVMSRKDLESIPEIILSGEDKNFARGEFEGLQVDLLLTTNPLFKKAQEDYVSETEINGRTIRIISVEGLVVLKLYAIPSMYRQGNFTRAALYENDILLLLLNHQVSMDVVFEELKKHVLASDMEEISQIVEDTQRSIARIKRDRA